MPLGEAVAVTVKTLGDHLMESGSVRAYLEALPKGKGMDCPNSPIDELVKHVATQRGDIDVSDPYLNLKFISELIWPVFLLERDLIMRAVKAADGEVETMNLLTLYRDFGAAHDWLWKEWFKMVAAPYQALSEDGKKSYQEALKDFLPAYDYTCFRYDESSQNPIQDRRTWCQAFPRQISLVLSTIHLLKTAPGQDEATRNYWAALEKAYGCKRIEELEELWTKVDEDWIKIPNDSLFVPVHGMESGYEHPFGVSPEFRLEVRTGEYAESIERSRAGVIRCAREVFGLREDTASQLKLVDTSVFACAVRSGFNLNFRSAGQSVPNRKDVVAKGSKVFLNEASPARIREDAHTRLNKLCAPGTASLLMGAISLEGLMAHTINHEFSHPVGRTKKSDEGIGPSGRALLEEAKATLLGTVSEEFRDGSPGHRLTLTAQTVNRLLRFMNSAVLSNPTVAPYVRENLVAATTLFESRVMKLTAEGVAVDRALAESGVWFREYLRPFCASVLKAYAEHDVAALEELTKRYCNKEGEQIAALIRHVNK